MYRRSAMCAAIDEYIINPRYRQILKLRYCDGQTYEKIAEICNYSTQHIKYICKKYKDSLLSRL